MVRVTALRRLSGEERVLLKPEVACCERFLGTAATLRVAEAAARAYHF